MMLLLAYAAISHDVVQASINAWDMVGDYEVTVLNVTEENALSVIKKHLENVSDELIGISDASVMPLRKVPMAVYDIPFLYPNQDDRFILPIMAPDDDIKALLDDPTIQSVQDLKMAIAKSRGHSLPFDTEWAKDCLLLPVASKNPNEQLLKEFIRKKYFIRFKPGCVSEKTIRVMRELFPSHEKVDTEKDAPEVPASEEGEKKEDEEVQG